MDLVQDMRLAREALANALVILSAIDFCMTEALKCETEGKITKAAKKAERERKGRRKRATKRPTMAAEA